MEKEDIYRVLDKEIDWCRDNAEVPGTLNDYELGFVKGVQQAKLMIKFMQS